MLYCLDSISQRINNCELQVFYASDALPVVQLASSNNWGMQTESLRLHANKIQ